MILQSITSEWANKNWFQNLKFLTQTNKTKEKLNEINHVIDVLGKVVIKMYTKTCLVRYELK